MIYLLVARPRATLNRSDAFQSPVSTPIDPWPHHAADYAIVVEAARSDFPETNSALVGKDSLRTADGSFRYGVIDEAYATAAR